MSVSPSVINSDQLTNTSSGVLISDHQFAIFQYIVGTFLCQVIDIFGVVTNIINIVCFTRQGFKDPVNVSLTGLAISDLCSLATLIWSNICLMPLFSNVDLPFNPIETQYIISGIPHTTFARISGWITALITLERCLCIAVPLKVKELVTSRRVSIIVMCVFAVHFISVVPLFVVCRLDMKWSSERNRTILGLVFEDHIEVVETFSFVFNSGFLSFTAFLIIIVCTLILVVSLYTKAKWRDVSTMQGQADILSNRNMKVAKMVVIISLLFIICFIPISISFLAMTLVPGLSIVGKHRNILLISALSGLLLESVNSSANIFIYYHMSSKYRDAFDKMFYVVTNVSSNKTKHI